LSIRKVNVVNFLIFSGNSHLLVLGLFCNIKRMHRTKEKVLPEISSILLTQLPENAFQAICERLPGLVAVYNVSTGNYLFVNQVTQTLLGYSLENFMKGGIDYTASLIHPEDLPKVRALHNAALEKANRTKARNYASGDSIMSFEYRMRHSAVNTRTG
jgi:PAS domain-containing protein